MRLANLSLVSVEFREDVATVAISWLHDEWKILSNMRNTAGMAYPSLVSPKVSIKLFIT